MLMQSEWAGKHAVLTGAPSMLEAALIAARDDNADIDPEVHPATAGLFAVCHTKNHACSHYTCVYTYINMLNCVDPLHQ
jgi:hypothetical protein